MWINERPMLGISLSAWAEACEVMGHDNAANTAAARVSHLRSSPEEGLSAWPRRARVGQNGILRDKSMWSGGKPWLGFLFWAAIMLGAVFLARLHTLS